MAIVVLIHGIRDHALWQNEVRKSLESNGFTVKSTNYGRFGLAEFLSPFDGGRRRARVDLEKHLNTIASDNPDEEINVIAHSFGTYLLAEVHRQNKNLKFHRVIFCGSVLSRSTEFQNVSSRLSLPILNEVGDLDPWPAVAESLTWWYGAAGTVGLTMPEVVDRWNTGAGHGFYLEQGYCEKKWVPFLKNGVIEHEVSPAQRPPWWVRLLLVFQLKYVLLIILTLLLALWIWWPRFSWPPGPGLNTHYVYYETAADGSPTEDGRLVPTDGVAITIDKIKARTYLEALSTVRLRSAPSSSAPIVGQIGAGSCVHVQGEVQNRFGAFGGWLPVEKTSCP